MRTKVLFAALLLSATTAFAQQEKLGSGIDKTNMDLTIKPGNDFYRYAAGNWIRIIHSMPSIPTMVLSPIFLSRTRSASRTSSLNMLPSHSRRGHSDRRSVRSTTSVWTAFA